MNGKNMSVRFFRTIHIALVITVCLAFTSCKDDLFSPAQQPDKGIPVKVQVKFRIPQFDDSQSSATRSATGNSDDRFFHLSLNAPEGEMESKKTVETRTAGNEAGTPLYNLWVLQFGADGKARKITRVSTTEKPVYENETIEVELLTGSGQTIYLLALGKQYASKDLTEIKTLSEFESTTFDFVRYEDGLPVAIINNQEDVPYRGSCSGITITQLEDGGSGYVDYGNSPDFSGAIRMKALVSLVSFDFSYDVSGMTPYMLLLNNVPTTFVVNNDNYKPSQFVNLNAVLFDPGDLSKGKRYTAKWYVAPNRQGVVPEITREADRYAYYLGSNTSITGKAPVDGTYLQLWASKDADPTNYALYYIFLGSNLTNDFNVNPHGYYKYRTDINTADDINDKRIVFKTLEQRVDFSASASYSGSLAGLRFKSDYDLRANAEMRPIEITALRGQVSVEILQNGNDASPVDPSTSWLKISTYPNYTAALNGKRSGDTNALGTSVTLNASIPGLFRLYLYSDEYEKYVSDKPTNYKRSLFIRFTFRTSTSVTNTYVVRMDQRPGFYLGQFGGEMKISADGAYFTEGLAIEDQSSTASIKYLSYMSDPYLYRAYLKIPEADIILNGGYDIYDGRSTTIQMAENKHNLSVITGGTSNAEQLIQVPRYVGGHVDLYQYKYYTGDGFAQRRCYDKNRDKDGNGYLTDDEIVWYMPSYSQVVAIASNYYTTSTDYLRNYSSGIGTSSISSVTMPGSVSGMAVSLSNFGATSESSVYLRCVRNVPVQDNIPKGGVRYYVEDGYAVIDATGLMEGVPENRVNNPDLFIQPFDHPSNDPNYIGRVRRYYTTSSDIDHKVSRRFRVAPTDIKVDGTPSTVPVNMTWAEAAGYNTAVNTKPITAGSVDEIANTGCPAYKGINGVEDPSLGKWRLPTAREAILIGMMDQAIRKDNSKTNYVGLSNILPKPWIDHYWTASEEQDGTSDSSKNRAFYFGLYSSSSNYDSNQYTYRTYSAQKSQKGNAGRYLVRCIQDLP